MLRYHDYVAMKNKSKISASKCKMEYFLSFTVFLSSTTLYMRTLNNDTFNPPQIRTEIKGNFEVINGSL